MPKHDFEIFRYISCRISNFFTPVFTKNEFELSKIILGLWKFVLAKKIRKSQSTELHAKNFVIDEKCHPDTTFLCTVSVTTPFVLQYPSANTRII